MYKQYLSLVILFTLIPFWNFGESLHRIPSLGFHGQGDAHCSCRCCHFDNVGTVDCAESSLVLTDGSGGQESSCPFCDFFDHFFAVEPDQWFSVEPNLAADVDPVGEVSEFATSRFNWARGPPHFFCVS